MITEQITFKQLINIGSWFERHFNSIFKDKINCFLDYDNNYWEIKSTFNNKLIKLKLDKNLYKCRVPFYKNIIPDTLIIGNYSEKIDYLHVICSSKKQIYKINTISDIDIVGISFWFLSRLEEADFNSSRDRYQRFTFEESHSFRAKIIHKPIVDEWLYLLANELFGIVNYKSNYKVNITHDIDTIYRYNNNSKVRKLLSKLKDSFRTSNNFRKNFFYSDYKKEPFNTFEYLINKSEEYNVKSKFFFIPSNMNSSMDGDYRIDSYDIKKILLFIKDKGHEIGVNPGYEAINNHKKCLNNINYFNKILENLNINKVADCRMHLLRWKHPKTLYLLKEINIKRDWTMGYPQIIGFRSATCNKYSLINPKTYEDINITEYPLNIMDFTLSFRDYMGSENDSFIFNKIKDLRDRSKNFNGTINILWHNNNVAWNNDIFLYEKILLCLNQS